MRSNEPRIFSLPPASAVAASQRVKISTFIGPILRHRGAESNRAAKANRQTVGLAAALARSALRANTTRAGADHLLASAMRAGRIHEHAAERFLHPVGMRVAVAVHTRRTIVSHV